MKKGHTVAQLARALLASSKVPGLSPGSATDDFLSFFRIWLASVEFRREKSSTRHVTSDFIILYSRKFSDKAEFRPFVRILFSHSAAC